MTENKNKRRDEVYLEWLYPSHLISNREECIKNNKHEDRTDYKTYILGWDARDEELRGKVEFDENPAIKHAFVLSATRTAYIFNEIHPERYFSQINCIEIAVGLARWQFEQLSDKLARHQYEIDGYETMHNEMKARIATLEEDAGFWKLTYSTREDAANKLIEELNQKIAALEKQLKAHKEVIAMMKGAL